MLRATITTVRLFSILTIAAFVMGLALALPANAMTNGTPSYHPKFTAVVSYYSLSDQAIAEHIASRTSENARSSANAGSRANAKASANAKSKSKDAGGSSSCTGTFITPRHMLTATHCWDNFIVPTDFYSQAIVQFPYNTYTKVDETGFADSVLRKLKVYHFTSLANGKPDLMNSPDVSIIEYPQNTYRGFIPVSFERLAPGDDIIAAGYGCDRAKNKPRTDFQFGNFKVANSSRFVTGLRKGAAALCPGDSGGPILKTMADGTLAVVGVISYYNSVAGHFSNSRDRAVRIDSETHGRVDLWIKSVLAGEQTPMELE